MYNIYGDSNPKSFHTQQQLIRFYDTLKDHVTNASTLSRGQTEQLTTVISLLDNNYNIYSGQINEIYGGNGTGIEYYIKQRSNNNLTVQYVTD